MIKTLVTLKQFGALCAVESVVAVTFLVTVALCIHEGELIAAFAAFGIAAGAVVLGVVRYRQLDASAKRILAQVAENLAAPIKTETPKRNRAKPAKAAPRPKRAKVKRK